MGKCEDGMFQLRYWTIRYMLSHMLPTLILFYFMHLYHSKLTYCLQWKILIYTALTLVGINLTCLSKSGFLCETWTFWLTSYPGGALLLNT